MRCIVASMNTRKEYPIFEELWTCCAQEKSRISAKEKFQRKDDDQAYTTKFKKFRNKKFDSRKKPNQEKDMSKIQCFKCRKYGHYKNQCSELKKRKETHEATIAEEKEPSKKVKQDETYFFF
jgi:hypothetical protein